MVVIKGHETPSHFHFVHTYNDMQQHQVRYFKHSSFILEKRQHI